MSPHSAPHAVTGTAPAETLAYKSRQCLPKFLFQAYYSIDFRVFCCPSSSIYHLAQAPQELQKIKAGVIKGVL